MTRVLRVVYRLVHVPASQEEDFVPLWLCSDRVGVFSHETALALHDLSEALPSYVNMRLPTAWRHRRQLLFFERFLARVEEVAGEAVILKGGLVLVFRPSRERTTKDVDLRMSGSADGGLDKLQEAARLDLGDFIPFEVRPDPDHPAIQRKSRLTTTAGAPVMLERYPRGNVNSERAHRRPAS